MSWVLWNEREGVPVADENVVRRNTFVVEPDAPPAEAQGAPEPNEVETDPNPDLGLVNRQVASEWKESEQYAPGWIPQVDANHNHNDIIDRQVSSSGTAAAREAAGQFGHGTLAHAVGIEPVGDLANPNTKMGNTYFVRDAQDINGTGAYAMSVPPGMDRDTVGAVAGEGKDDARDATQASQYAAWYSALMTG